MGFRNFMNALMVRPAKPSPGVAELLHDVRSQLALLEQSSGVKDTTIADFERMANCTGCDRLQFACFLVDESPWPIMVSTLSGETIYLNEQLSNLVGVDTRNFDGLRIRSLVDPERLDDWDQHWGRLMACGKSTVDAWLKGSGKTVHVVSSIVQLSSGQVVLNFMHDRTEIDRLYRLCEEGVENMRAFISTSPGIMALCDKDHRVMAVSRGWMTLFARGGQFAEHQLLGSICDTHHIIVKLASMALDGHSVSGQRVDLATCASTDSYAVTCVAWHQNEHMAGVAIYVDALGARMRIEDELRRRRIMTQAIFKTLPKPMSIMDAEGTLIDANDAFMQRCSATNSQQILGRRFWEVCEPCRKEMGGLSVEQTIKGLAAMPRRQAEIVWECQVRKTHIHTTFRAFPVESHLPVELIVHEESSEQLTENQ